MPDGFTAMPDGCAALNVGIRPKGLSIDLSGPTTRPCIIGGHTNQFDMVVGIDFQPGGLYALTGIGQSELTDRTYDLGAVNAALSKQIAEAVESSGSVCALVARLDTLLLENLYTTCHVQLKPMFQHILASSGNITTKALSGRVHYSERQLNRIFQENVGLSAKSFSRLVRMYGAFRLLKKPQYSLTLVSDMAGYYDLSHFVRDFCLVCGVPPQEYRDNMSAFYTNTAKY